MAVPHRAQRGVFAAAAAQAGNRSGGRAAARETAARGMLPIELSLAVESALEALERRSARSGFVESLSGIQVRGDGGNFGLPGVDREIAALYRARSLKTTLAPVDAARRIMSCKLNIPIGKHTYSVRLDRARRREAEAHAMTAQAAGRSGRLRADARCALHLREEEVPRRIAFVSDKVFEPAGGRCFCGLPLRREPWWRPRSWCTAFAPPAGVGAAP